MKEKQHKSKAKSLFGFFTPILTLLLVTIVLLVIGFVIFMAVGLEIEDWLWHKEHYNGYPLTEAYAEYVPFAFTVDDTRHTKQDILGERYNDSFRCYDVYYSLTDIDPDFMVYVERPDGILWSDRSGYYVNPERIDEITKDLTPSFSRLRISRRAANSDYETIYATYIVTQACYELWQAHFWEAVQKEADQRESLEAGSGEAYLSEQNAVFDLVKECIVVVDTERAISFLSDMLKSNTLKYWKNDTMWEPSFLDSEGAEWRVTLLISEEEYLTCQLKVYEGKHLWFFEAEDNHEYCFPLSEAEIDYFNDLFAYLGEKSAEEIPDPGMIIDAWKRGMPKELPLYNNPYS